MKIYSDKLHQFCQDQKKVWHFAAESKEDMLHGNHGNHKLK